MKIGIVTTWFERGAAYVSRQLRDVLSKTSEVYIYARGGELYAENDSSWNLPSVTWGKRGWRGVTTEIHLRDFKRWIESNDIEVVIFNEQRWWPPVFACRELGVKTGAYIDYYTEETIEFFGIYDFLICNTNRHVDAFSWHRNCIYIPWGTDITLYDYEGRNSAAKKKIVFFHSAGMNPHRKGTDFLLKAFCQVGSPAKLIVHTQVKLDDYFPELTGLIDSLLEGEKLSIIHKTIPAPGAYNLGDVYVYPSRLEGIGLSIAEALACGLPVIVPDNPPMNEFCDESSGKTVRLNRLYARRDGYYWPACEVSIDDLTCKMEFYVENRLRIDEYRRSAREYAEKNLDWLKNAMGLVDYIRQTKSLAGEDVRKLEQKIQAFEYRTSPAVLKLPKAIGVPSAYLLGKFRSFRK